MAKKIGLKKLLIIIFSSLVVIGAAVTTTILVSNNAAQNNSDDNRGEDDPLAPISRGVELILGEGKVTEYYLGDSFIAPVVFGKFGSDSFIDLSSSEKLTIDGYNMSKAGLQVVNVKYEDGDIYGRVSYKIYIYNAVPTSLSASYQDENITWGEKLDKDKITAVLRYSNNKEKRISDYTLKYNSKPDNYGPNVAKVIYEEFETTFTVNVVEKPVDSEYSYIENEMKRLLNILGYENPTCPKDYSYSKDSHGNAVFSNNGSLTSYKDKPSEELTNFIKNVLFDGYTLLEGPVESYDLVFLSDKYVFEHETKNVTAKIYLLKNDPSLRYSFTLK